METNKVAIFRIIELDVLVPSSEGPKSGMRFIEANDAIQAAHKFYDEKPNASDHILIVTEENVDEHWRDPNNPNTIRKK